MYMYMYFCTQMSICIYISVDTYIYIFLRTRVSSSLIEYPINKALFHICFRMKATSWKHTHI